MRLPAAVVIVCLLAGGRAVAREHHREHKADGRHHLEKANALAGDGKCAAAVKEFTAAYETLQDPIILFNRADCYRRLGENAKAAEDYRGFLKGFPAAPNRAEIEARIATLEKPAMPPPRPPVVAARPPPGATAPPPIARTPAPNTPAASPAARTPAPNTPAPPPTAPPASEAIGPLPFLPPPPTGGDAKTLVEAPRSTPSETPHAEAQGSRWWLWTTLAVVVVGGGAAGYWFFLRPKDEPLPMTTLGNYRY